MPKAADLNGEREGGDEDGRNEGRTERVHDLEEENGEQEGFAERNKGESIKGGREGRRGIERENFLAGRPERAGASAVGCGCALLVMELLAATQDKCPTYVESGESEREREREGEERELHCGNGYKCRE